MGKGVFERCDGYLNPGGGRCGEAEGDGVVGVDLGLGGMGGGRLCGGGGEQERKRKQTSEQSSHEHLLELGSGGTPHAGGLEAQVTRYELLTEGGAVKLFITNGLRQILDKKRLMLSQKIGMINAV